MPKRGAFALGLTAVALALLLGFQTPSDVVTVADRPADTGSGPGADTTTGASGSPGSPGSSGSGSQGSSGADAGTTGTRAITGPLVDTRWGPVQVAVTLQDRELVDVTALQLPVGGRSGEISDYVEPILRNQALEAQGSAIDGISGATFTSRAYARSLQAALDTAGA
jgi:hypothetical protein